MSTLLKNSRNTVLLLLKVSQTEVKVLKLAAAICMRINKQNKNSKAKTNIKCVVKVGKFEELICLSSTYNHTTLQNKQK